MLSSTPPPRRDEFQADAKSKMIFNSSENTEGKYNQPTQQHKHSCDILLNNFQIKKKRYKVLLNYDQIVWEQMDVKRCSSSKNIASNEKTPTAPGATAQNAAAATTAAAQKEAEYEREQLSHKAAYDNYSNVLHIHEVIRVSKGNTKSASVRNAHKPLESAEGVGPGHHNVITPTEQYLSIYYAERIVCSPIDCNRWHVRRLTLHNNDPYIVAKWHDNLQNLLRRAGRLSIKRLLVFINPYGGRKMGLQTYERTCKSIIQLAGIDASCIITQRANQIRDILMSHDLSPFDAVCCVGGDGTVAEMINGLIMRAMQDKGLDLRRSQYIPKPALPIAIIPAGSTDTIAYSLHGTSDVQTAAIHLVLGQRRGLDICSVRNRDGIVRFCTSVMGYGYLGDVAAKSEKYRWMGTKRYEYTGVKSFLLNRGYEAEVHMLLNEDELDRGPSSAENLPNEQEVICNVNCTKCKLGFDNDADNPTSSSNASLNVGHNNATFVMEQEDKDSSKVLDNKHSKNVSHNNCDKEYSTKPLETQTQNNILMKNDDDDEIDSKQRSNSPGSSSTSSNFISHQPQIPASDASTTNEARKWRIIRGEFFMITAANITCSCMRSPNGISRYCHLGDGHLDVVLVRKTSLLNNLRFVVNTMGRDGDIRNLPFVEVYRTKQFMFKTNSSNWLQDYNSVRGSSQPIADSLAESETNALNKLYSSWNCDGEVVSDLEITMKNNAVLPEQMLLLTLRYYATGCMQRMNGDLFGVSQPTASRVITLVSHNIALLREEYIKFPKNSDELNNVKAKFLKLAKFPAVIAAMDCTHIKIHSPGGDNAELYRNRKGFFSINVQTLCDSELQILDIVARWPGSTHDATIFRNSRICYRLESKEFGKSLVVADSGYENSNFVITPLLKTSTPSENLFNESLIRTRNCVERSYGVWKRRFPVLSLGIRMNLKKVQSIIVATGVLHNICCLNREMEAPILPPYMDEAINEVLSVPHTRNIRGEITNTTRKNLIQKYFASM